MQRDSSRAGPSIAAWLSVLVPVTGAGCSGEHAPDASAAEVWEIRSAPTLVIGGAGDPPAGALHMVADATRLADGSIAVANGGLESRLPVFSAQGSYLRTLGKLGDGPGEFRWITSVQAGPVDSLYVYDGSLQRLTALAPDGQVRTVSFRPSAVRPGADRLRVVTRLDDDHWVASGMEMPLRGDVDEMRRDTVLVGVLDGALERLRALEQVPGRISLTFEVGGRRAFGGAPFSPSALQAAWGRCVFVARGDRPTISVYSADGRLLSRFDAPGSPRPVDAAHREAWLEDRLRSVEPADRGIYRRAFQDVPWVDALPYFSQMVADRWGRLWLQEFEPPTGSGRRWHVLAQSGARLGEAVLPKAMAVFEIDEHGILGRTTGELDQELVELIPLDPVPPGSGAALGECRSG